MKLLTVLALAVLALPVAQANELDNENQVKNAQRFAADLPQTVVVREDAQGNVAVMHSSAKLIAGAEASLDDSKFVPVKKAGKELDGDSSKSGWYFYWYNYNYSYYPAYYYYGYNYYYQPYYNYSYNNYTYYWYSWSYRWSWGW
jgi:hypothetical protein